MSDTIYDDCFIVMSEYGIQRMTKRPGSLKRGEVSVRVRLHVPEKVFKEPVISVDVTVPESAIIVPAVTIDVLDPPEQPSHDD